MNRRFATVLEPSAQLHRCCARGRFVEALEVAVRHLPHRVPFVLREAGHAYHEQGLHARLYALLSELPEDLRRDETVLFWRLGAAVRLGRGNEVRNEVEAHLACHEAPELRALYAGTLAPLERSAQVMRSTRGRRPTLIHMP